MGRDRSNDDKVYRTFAVELIRETPGAYRFVDLDDGVLFWVPKSVCRHEEGTNDALIEVWFCNKNDL